MTAIETINRLDQAGRSRLSSITREDRPMPIHDFLRCLLAAYAAGASGSCPQELA
ncbi:hypothetical protein [Aquipseudomonas alcaligenes]|uniref:hypothetical protein n=1 Tax=Aquipseudomonas alcaligenes TaxID=43263 RepID=UPI0015E89E7B|nr:hypothetical protein [Pseudomonas alcaligenes]